ncbi:MAG: hypothetical protein WC972_13695 [Trueperaceae bacterium]
MSVRSSGEEVVDQKVRRRGEEIVFSGRITNPERIPHAAATWHRLSCSCRGDVANCPYYQERFGDQNNTNSDAEAVEASASSAR